MAGPAAHRLPFPHTRSGVVARGEDRVASAVLRNCKRPDLLPRPFAAWHKSALLAASAIDMRQGPMSTGFLVAHRAAFCNRHQVVGVHMPRPSRAAAGHATRLTAHGAALFWCDTPLEESRPRETPLPQG